MDENENVGKGIIDFDDDKVSELPVDATEDELETYIESQIEAHELYLALKEAVQTGNNQANQTVRQELMLVDDSWIKTIEDSITAIDNIVKHPKTFIKDQRELVPVEKARRVDSLSIRHLSSHSEYVRSVDKYGNVEPIKVLTKQMEEELATYENRVVYTLIQLLRVFVDERYTSLKALVARYETTNLKLKSDFPFGKSKIKVDLNMQISQRKTKKESGQNAVERLARIRQKLNVLLGTQFCRALSTTKLITPPIKRTNMLTKQADYRACYDLWLFISSFKSIGYSQTISDKELSFDNDYYADLTNLIVKSVQVMIENNVLRRGQYKNVKFKDKKVKEFKAIKKVELELNDRSKDVKFFSDEDAINQFYYEKMRGLVKSISQKSSAKDVEEIHAINVNFRRFYKGMAKLNNAMMYDMMKWQADQREAAARLKNPKASALEKKQIQLRKEREICKKMSLLVELKKTELESLEAKELLLKQKMHKLEMDVSARSYVQEKKRKERILKGKLADEKARQKAELAAKRAEEREAKRALALLQKNDSTDGLTADPLQSDEVAAAYDEEIDDSVYDEKSEE